ncbi:hypothetical protein FMM56_04165 [Campylobacter sp. LR264d]|uniref:hypothetical protein n=1 Tax=Campylobacter sp. LR264d TaxID=2593544 RepID=UPI0012389968|nr:hypothetical protein [Campylobacter sp. LR264d]KAA6231357.1 hypothetical protein FMM56_04165 [Campylobacter sp. LR264d]
MLAFFKGLGVGLLCLLLFLAGVIFNVEFLKNNSNELHFSTDLSVKMPIKADSFTASIEFYSNENLSKKLILTNEDKESIDSSFKSIFERVKNNGICVEKEYTLKPHFAQKDSFKLPMGQRLEASLDCEFKEMEIFDNLFKDILKEIEKSEFIAVSNPKIHPKISPLILEENEKILNKELISKAYSLESVYSIDLNKTCTLKSIRTNSMKDRKPIQNFNKEQEQVLNALIGFTCK